MQVPKHESAPGWTYETVCTFGLPKLVRTAPVSDPCFAGRGLSLERGAHFLAHVGRFIAFWQKWPQRRENKRSLGKLVLSLHSGAHFQKYAPE